MNISSLQPLNTRYTRIAYATIISSILLLAGISVVSPSLATDEKKIVLETLCNTYGNTLQINREGRQETVSFGEWISLFRPDLLELFNEVGCPGEILDVTWSHQFVVIALTPRVDDDAGMSSVRLFAHDVTFTGDVTADCFGAYSTLILDRAVDETNNFWWDIICKATVDGKSGTFVLLVEGVNVRTRGNRPDARTGEFTWKVVSAGGELMNLSGEGTGDYSGGVPPNRIPEGPDCDLPDPGCLVFVGTFTGELRLPN